MEDKWFARDVAEHSEVSGGSCFLHHTDNRARDSLAQTTPPVEAELPPHSCFELCELVWRFLGLGELSALRCSQRAKQRLVTSMNASGLEHHGLLHLGLTELGGNLKCSSDTAREASACPSPDRLVPPGPPRTAPKEALPPAPTLSLLRLRSAFAGRAGPW